MKLQDVILKAMAKKISWLEAAEIIGVCDRTMRRMREGYQQFGYTGLMDRRSGKQSEHRVPMEQAEEVLRLYSYTWVQRALQGAGLVAKRHKRGLHHWLRPGISQYCWDGKLAFSVRLAGESARAWRQCSHRHMDNARNRTWL
jgi:hypothetical protein